MAVSFNLKIKSSNNYKISKKTKNGREVSELITSSLRRTVAGIAGTAVTETVRQHNERVIAQAAIFFQRVVSRTPKDESYYDPVSKTFHKADDDYVWKNWKILYWGKSITAEEMGEELFADDADFNNKQKIQTLIKIIKEKLFRGDEKFGLRKSRIRNIRFENTHPRFALLEYGMYDKDSDYIKSKKYEHGVKNGYSVQAPYGMLRITQAEMESMSIKDFDKYFKQYKSYTKGVKKIPSESQAAKLLSIIERKNRLTDKDIENIGNIMEKAK